MASIYDLTPKIGEYLDPHLLLPVLNFMQDQELYPAVEIQRAKMGILLEKTNMVDYAGDIYEQIKPDALDFPDIDMDQKKQELIAKLSDVTGKCHKFIALRKDEKLRHFMTENQFNAPYLEEHHGITKEDIDAIYYYAKFQYECGKYDLAIDFLDPFRVLNRDPHKDIMALWGKLSSEILMSKWSEAEHDIGQIRDAIETLSTSPLKQLQHRLWLIHWSLFVYFHRPNGAVALLDFFLGNERYLRAIELKAPWILRYLTVAAILTKHRLPELVKMVKQESANYSDPITEFIRYLYVKFDFDSAEKELEKCENVLESDYFVQKRIVPEFMNNARLAICEVFCKIHSTIDIAMMSKKLRLSMEESEWWIVNLIRAAKLDAKIDSARNTVIVTSQAPSVYQQLLDKTNTLSLRADALASIVDRGKIQAQRAAEAHGEQ